MTLAASDYGAGPPLVVLHGLFGSGRNWAGIARQLAAVRSVHVLDLPNHGQSPWTDAMGYPEMAAAVAGWMDGRGLPAAALLGHSMGGKVAMMLALTQPARVERLVVVDVAPVPYPPHLLAYARAMRAVDLGRITRRAEVDAELAAVVDDTAERQFLLQNLVSGDGGLRWRLNLPVIEAALPAISGFPDLPPEAAYPGPALFIAGGLSRYLQPAHEPAIRARFPAARLVTVPNAGHWVHAERPETVLAELLPFLSS